MHIRLPLPRFVRSSRPDPAPPVPNHDIRLLPSPNHPDTQLAHPDRKTILAQWERLGTLVPRSHDYAELLRRLVDVEANRNLALEFTDNDASIVINVIGEALRTGMLQSKLAHHSFSVLRKLAGKTGRLPVNYLVSKDTDYQVEATIFASGGFADVRKGKLGKRAVAVKTIRVAQDVDIFKIRKDFCKESVLWMQVSHPNVLELLAVDIGPHNKTFSLISELMVNGNIMEYTRANKANRIRLLEDVTRGLRYLHTQEIIHGDLKGTNILIKNGAPPQACISDFGFSTIAPTMSFAMPTSADEYKGTWSHMAPELLFPTKFGLSDGRVSKQADIYAFGVVVYEVLVGRTPFGGEGHPITAILMLIMEGKRASKPENADDIGFSKGTWELVQRCWHQDRDKRPVVEDVRQHFQLVARSSRVVPPGSTTLAREVEHSMAPGLDSSFRDFGPLFAQTSANIVQQIKFVAGVVASGGSLHSAVSVPSVQFIRAKPSLFDRLGARIKGRRPALRLVAPASPLARA